MQYCATAMAAWRDPVEVLSGLADAPFTVGLLSSGDRDDARWSYVAASPEATLVAPFDASRDPFQALSDFAGEACQTQPDGPPFQGGVIGLATYELGARAEAVDLDPCGSWPVLVCGRYASILAFDHLQRSVFAVGRGASVDDAERARDLALGWHALPDPTPHAAPLGSWFTSTDGEDYEQAVAAVTGAIGRGDFFQANIARRWRGRLTCGARPFDLARQLAKQSPAPFAAYLRLDDRAVVSNSPERFLRVVRDQDQWRVETRPIKGTSPRFAEPAADADSARLLAGSAKDRAENLMIVDLMRNDLARVCSPGGVTVDELFRIETFANVHHLVSTVSGRLAPGRTAVDLLRASFPPGSVTGAPKVQAMKAIAQLEPPRGPYCGSIFWLGCDGAFDSSVLIRTVACELADGAWSIEARAGAGIVADSQPAAERRETEAKIEAIRSALT